MDNFWNKVIFYNSISQWLICFAIIVFTIILLRAFQAIVITRLKKTSDRSKNTIDDFLISILQIGLMPMLYILAFFIGLKYIELPTVGDRIIHVAITLVATFFCIKILTSFIAYLFKQGLSRNDPDAVRAKQAKGILLIVQALMWVIGVLFLVDNFGYNITTLIAGLGIGGIAIALAAQTILGDLFNYLVIFFDKPFEIGDFINIGDKVGTVQRIGVKTTRIKTLSGEQLICSNTDLTTSRIHNFKRMIERRIVFSFGVTYDTPLEKLKAIPPKIQSIIDEMDGIRYDRAHFKSFGDYSLVFEVVYIVLADNFNLYMDKQQEINFSIMQAFEENKIEFAFPTQTLNFAKNFSEATVEKEATIN